MLLVHVVILLVLTNSSCRSRQIESKNCENNVQILHVQWLAKRDVDSINIDNLVRYHRENIKYLLESLY